MNKKGFTLIELLVVISILAILAALVSGNFLTSLKKGRDARRKADLEQTQRALEMYYEDKKVYPATAAVVFGTSLTDSVSGKVYMQKLPKDPISSYTYEYKLISGSYELYACLENSQQVLSYNTLTTTPNMTCNIQCKKSDGTPTTAGCIWALSSPDISP